MDIPRKYRQLLLPAACIALLLLTLKYLLPLVLPVLLGIGIAAALSPLIRFLQSRLSLGRSLSAGVCVTGVLLLLAALFWLLAKALAAEAGRLYDQLPAIMDTLSRALDAFGRWAQQLAQLLPDGAGDAFSSWAQDIIRSGGHAGHRGIRAGVLSGIRLSGAAAGYAAVPADHRALQLFCRR